MARYTKQLHFLRNGEIRDVQLYTSLSDVVDANVINADGTTGGISLYTSTDDVDYPYLRLMEGNTPVYAALEELTASNTTETGLKVSANGVNYVVAKDSFIDVFGICCTKNGNTYEWHMIDIYGNPLSYSPNFDDIAPWGDITPLYIDGQAMTKIPKFYVKCGEIAIGPYAGSYGYWISRTIRSNFTVHPAFIRNGSEMDCFYISSYFAYGSTGKRSGIAGSASGQVMWAWTSREDVVAGCNGRNTDATVEAKRGWHLPNIYEEMAIRLLILIEGGTPDFSWVIKSSSVDSGDTTTSANGNVWRYLYNYEQYKFEFCDGIKLDSNKCYMVFNENMDGTYVSTGIKFPYDTDNNNSNNFVTDVLKSKEPGFNGPLLFLPVSIGTQSPYSSSIYSGGSSNPVPSGHLNARRLCSYLVDEATLGFRIAKYGNVS